MSRSNVTPVLATCITISGRGIWGKVRWGYIVSFLRSCSLQQEPHWTLEVSTQGSIFLLILWARRFCKIRSLWALFHLLKRLFPSLLPLILFVSMTSSCLASPAARLGGDGGRRGTSCGAKAGPENLMIKRSRSGIDIQSMLAVTL